MKDKEKQIEEMPICANCFHAYVCEEYNLNRDMLRKKCAYYNDHFLDIDSVVLSREEYSDYLILQQNHKFIREKAKELQADNERLYKNIRKFKELVSKETAEKIIAMLKQPPYIDFIESWVIEDIAKEYGIEV